MNEHNDEVNLCPLHEKGKKAPGTGAVDAAYQNPVGTECLICSNRGNSKSSMPQAHSNTNIKFKPRLPSTSGCNTLADFTTKLWKEAIQLHCFLDRGIQFCTHGIRGNSQHSVIMIDHIPAAVPSANGTHWVLFRQFIEFSASF
ncbi:unnamed protein product [Penicillium discolor]